jgi:hypothetical protein
LNCRNRAAEETNKTETKVTHRLFYKCPLTVPLNITKSQNRNAAYKILAIVSHHTDTKPLIFFGKKNPPQKTTKKRGNYSSGQTPYCRAISFLAIAAATDETEPRLSLLNSRILATTSEQALQAPFREKT